MWTYESSTGKLYDPFYKYAGVGYSGFGLDKNNPTDENVKDKGPIPTGLYTIKAPVNSPVHGRYSLPLDPDPTNIMYGRDLFLIHGDSIVDPGTASEGCIIMGYQIRINIWESGDHRLVVVDKFDG